MNELLELDGILISNVHTETISDREFVVAEAVILREGVLHGSDGPLFYPYKEISKSVGMWNGFPLVAPHPYIWENGEMKHVSARDPRVGDQFTIGAVHNDRMEKADDGTRVRKVDLYFDVEKTNNVDGRIIPMVRSGEPINVSTGIYTDKREAVGNSFHNGTRYTHTVHNISPDHLAVLMDERGACSVHDGCGINVNSEGSDIIGRPIVDRDVLGMTVNKSVTVVVPAASKPSVGEYLGALLCAGVTAHILHLQTRSFAAHMALDELYKELPSLVDDLIEEYQGCYQTIVKEYGRTDSVPSDPFTFVSSLSDYTRNNRDVIGDKTNLQNTLDEILSLFDGVMYKLKFLS